MGKKQIQEELQEKVIIFPSVIQKKKMETMQETTLQWFCCRKH